MDDMVDIRRDDPQTVGDLGRGDALGLQGDFYLLPGCKFCEVHGKDYSSQI